jgi:hypothetical protein
MAVGLGLANCPKKGRSPRRNAGRKYTHTSNRKGLALTYIVPTVGKKRGGDSNGEKPHCQRNTNEKRGKKGEEDEYRRKWMKQNRKGDH